MAGLRRKDKDDDCREGREVLEDVLQGKWWEESIRNSQVGEESIVAKDEDEQSEKYGREKTRTQSRKGVGLGWRSV